MLHLNLASVPTIMTHRIQWCSLFLYV